MKHDIKVEIHKGKKNKNVIDSKMPSKKEKCTAKDGLMGKNKMKPKMKK